MGALVVGQGNAGIRHAELLRLEGYKVKVLSRRDDSELFSEFETGKKSLAEFDFVLLATESSHHEEFLSQANFQGFKGRILVEKPAILSSSTIEKLSEFDARVAYNLRYLDGLIRLKSRLQFCGDLLRIGIQSHSYLPKWRQDSVTRGYYSEYLEKGGGALYDLSHEIDYSRLIAGDWSVVGALGGKIGEVTVDADDTWMVLGLSNSRAHINLSLSLISRVQVRKILADTKECSFSLDLLSGELNENGEVFKGSSVGTTYAEMIRDFTSGPNKTMPTIGENIKTLQIISEIRRASKELHGV